MENISDLSKYFFLKKKHLRKNNLETIRKLIRKCESLLLVIQNKSELFYCTSSVCCSSIQLGKSFRVENLRLQETQVIILVLSLIFPTIIARKRNASKGDFFILITNSIFLRQYQNFNDSYILWMSIMNTTTLTLSMFCNLICWQFLFFPVYNLQETGEISSQSK